MMSPVSDATICRRLRERDYSWFYTLEGQAALDTLRPRLMTKAAQDALTAMVDQRDYQGLHDLLEPLVCHPDPDQETAQAKPLPKWLAPLLIGLLLLLLLWLLLASCLDDWQRHLRGSTSPAPTVTVSPTPSVAPTTFAVFFANGQSTLDAADVMVLKAAARDVANKPATVTIVGMTDSTGTAQLNAALAAARAKQVQEMLLANGVTTSQITVRTHPQAAETSSGQARRVDIVVTPTG